MVRLRCPRCHERVRPLFERLTDQKFEFACLVAAQREAGLVITFDEYLRSTEFARKAFQFFNRGRQLRQGKARQFFDLHWSELYLRTGVRAIGTAAYSQIDTKRLGFWSGRARSI